jgi:hypothetical protein
VLPVSRRWIAAVLALVGVLAGSGFRTAGAGTLLTVPDARALAEAKGAKFPPATRPVTVDEVAARVARALSGIDPAEYDYTLRTGGLEAAFQFVRDRIAFESYAGALRGPGITYAARAGNAADRSLLLAALLRGQGITVRFARGTLAGAGAEALWARIFQAARPAGNPARTEASPLEQRLRARAARDYAFLREALGEPLPALGDVPRQAILDEIRAHVWVQARAGDAWVDLDASFADAAPGKTYCEVESTVDELSDEGFQMVTIRVVAETLAGSELKTQVMLEHRARAADLLDRQVFLTFGAGEVKDIASGVGGAIRSSGGGEVWTPALCIDGEIQGGSPIVFNETAGKPERGKPSGGGLSGVFGRGGALAGGQPVLVALYLDFEIEFPGNRRETTRRTLVDRAGPGWRGNPPDPGALRPLPRSDEGITTPRDLHNLWFTAGRHDLAAVAEAAALLSASGAQIPAGGDFGASVWPMAVQNFALPLLSDHLVIPSLNDRDDARFYSDSPRITIVTIGPVGATRGVQVAHDLRRDRVRGLARDAGARQAVSERLLWFAALEGALEHEVGVRGALAARLAESSVLSTSKLLDMQAGVVALKPGAEPAPEALPQDPGAAARIRSALGGGAYVIIPRPAPGEESDHYAGWWEFDGDGDVRAVYADLHGVFRGWWDGNPNRGGSGLGAPKVWRVPENAGHLKPEPPRGKTYTMEDLLRDKERLNKFKPRPRNPTRPLNPPPAASKKGKDSGGGPEYPAIIKLGAVIVITYGPIFISEAQRWAAEYLTAYVLEALDLAHEADRESR